ncbi:MAG: flagellar assembly protein FliW [Phycisphaeraceae bacterium]|nr:flagellar assembly protein FliW [Phycisphaeraceae bacterium]
MQIQTTRFGTIEIDDSRIITFPKGLLGFPDFTRYAMIEASEDPCFWWLQSIEAPDLAFVVTDPMLFVPTYRVPIRREQMDELGMRGIEQSQVLVIVNKHETVLTGNLQGPLVINCHTLEGEQMVLSDRRFNTRVPLVELDREVQPLRQSA